jgi:hypothetical protein
MPWDEPTTSKPSIIQLKTDNRELTKYEYPWMDETRAYPALRSVHLMMKKDEGEDDYDMPKGCVNVSVEFKAGVIPVDPDRTLLIPMGPKMNPRPSVIMVPVPRDDSLPLLSPEEDEIERKRLMDARTDRLESYKRLETIDPEIDIDPNFGKEALEEMMRIWSERKMEIPRSLSTNEENDDDNYDNENYSSQPERTLPVLDRTEILTEIFDRKRKEALEQLESSFTHFKMTPDEIFQIPFELPEEKKTTLLSDDVPDRSQPHRTLKPYVEPEMINIKGDKFIITEETLRPVYIGICSVCGHRLVGTYYQCLDCKEKKICICADCEWIQEHQEYDNDEELCPGHKTNHVLAKIRPESQ